MQADRQPLTYLAAAAAWHRGVASHTHSLHPIHVKQHIQLCHTTYTPLSYSNYDMLRSMKHHYHQRLMHRYLSRLRRTCAVGEEWCNGKVVEGCSELLGVSIAVTGDGTRTFYTTQAHTTLTYLLNTYQYSQLTMGDPWPTNTYALPQLPTLLSNLSVVYTVHSTLQRPQTKQFFTTQRHMNEDVTGSSHIAAIIPM